MDRKDFVPYKSRSYGEIIADVRNGQESFLIGAAKSVGVGLTSVLLNFGLTGGSKKGFLLQRIIREAYSVYTWLKPSKKRR